MAQHFDMMSAITAPGARMVTRPTELSRPPAGRIPPAVPLSKVPKYKGAGSIDDADNFVCAAPK